MKKTILLFTAVLITLYSFSQVPNWAWAKSIAGNPGGSGDRGHGIATDIYGNVIVTGYSSSSTLSFGTITLTNSSGSTNMFIAKYDSLGSVLWAKCFGDGVYATGVATDNDRNIFIIGYYTSPSISFGTTTLANNGIYRNIFFVKFDPDGNVTWAKSIGGSSNDEAYSIATDPSGNVVILANYTSPSITIGSNTLINKGNCDILLAKYSGSGSALWAKSIGGVSTDYGYSIATDNFGNVVATGKFISPSITDGVTTITNTKNTAMYIIKYDSLGNFMWSDSWSSSSLSQGRSVAADKEGNILLLGNFNDTLMTFGTITLTCQYASSALIKYDYLGNVIWAKICAEGKIEGSSIATDLQGSVFLAGKITCPQVIFGSSYLNNSGGPDMVIAKYDSAGNEKWGKNAGGISIVDCSDVATFKNDNVVVLGVFLSTVNFGTTTLTNSVSTQSTYVAKLYNSSLNGIDEVKMGNNFLVYPNPFTSQATINFVEVQKNITIKIIDELGNIIKAIDFTGKQLTLDKGEIKSGLYFIQIIDEKGNLFVKKIIIQ